MRGAAVQDLKTAAAPLLPLLPARAWLPWFAVRRGGNGKLDKVPWRATTNDPGSWRTLDMVLHELQAFDEVAGIGFAVTAGIIALDFDDCRNPVSGELDPEVKRELERFNSYAYVTPSHRGFRIIGLNNQSHPIHGQKRMVRLPGGKQVEIFVGPVNFYVTFTADLIPGYSQVRDISDETLDLLAGLPGVAEPDFAPLPGGGAEVSLRKLRETVAALPNEDLDWDVWNTVGMALWRCTGGDAAGFELFTEWSAKSRKHDQGATAARWQHYFRSPPTRVGFGKLVWLARSLPGGDPSFAPSLGLFRRPSAREGGDAGGAATAEGGGEPSASGQPGAEEAGPRGRPDELQSYSIAELKGLADPEWLIEGLLPAGAFIVPFGAPKSYKTFLMLSACLHIAAGAAEWMGLKISRGGGVVYVAGEGIGGLKLRIAAMCDYYKLGDDVPFWVIPRPVSLADRKALARLVWTIRKRAGDTPVVLVVFDTLARCMPGLDENSAQEVGAAIAGSDWVRDELSCSTVTIHHSGKDEERGLRGTSALRGALDTALLIECDGSRGTIKIEDQKDAECGPELHFEMREVPAGIGRTTLVPVPAGEQQPGKRKRRQVRLTPSARIGLNALDDAVLAHPVRLPAGYPRVIGTLAGHWREAFKARRADEKADTIRHAFSAASQFLSGNGIVAVRNDYVWRVDAEPEHV